MIKKEVGDELAVIGWTEGPFQGAMLLLGADPRALFLVKQDPGLLKQIIEWYGEFELAVARAMIDAGAAPGGGFWLSGGCEIPRDMPYGNMRAMLRSLQEYGRYPIGRDRD